VSYKNFDISPSCRLTDCSKLLQMCKILFNLHVVQQGCVQLEFRSSVTKQHMGRVTTRRFNMGPLMQPTYPYICIFQMLATELCHKCPDYYIPQQILFFLTTTHNKSSIGHCRLPRCFALRLLIPGPEGMTGQRKRAGSVLYPDS
jgi:hypothetical protein